ncbi:hypothetical protein ACMXN5_37785 [Embleya sp. MST-111070]
MMGSLLVVGCWLLVVGCWLLVLACGLWLADHVAVGARWSAPWSGEAGRCSGASPCCGRRLGSGRLRRGSGPSGAV